MTEAEQGAQAVSPGVEWADPRFFAEQSRTWNFFRLIKQLVVPPDGHKTLPTLPGMLLFALTFGIGTAAYNTSSNILFMTLSLLLTSILLSGVLAWMNFKGTRWRLHLESHFRAGKITPIGIELSNDKRLLPSYSLWFNVRADKSDVTSRIYLQERLDPQSSVRLDWIFEPERRGKEVIEINGLETQFPFGFLRKIVGGGIKREVAVWPKRIDYDFDPPKSIHAFQQGHSILKPGSGTELINLRDYQTGDPQRLVHWKASARMRRLMVRQMSEENQDAFLLFLETPKGIWKDEEQFEVLCSFVGALSEDLYLRNRLWGFALNDEPIRVVKRLGDLHALMEDLALLKRVEHYTPSDALMGATVVRFAPEKGKRVGAYVGGVKAGEA